MSTARLLIRMSAGLGTDAGVSRQLRELVKPPDGVALASSARVCWTDDIERYSRWMQEGCGCEKEANDEYVN